MSYTWFLILFLVSVYIVHGQSSQFYNVRDFGAIPDGKTDISKALLYAWSRACKDSGSTVLIPRNDFFLNPVTLNGPCSGPITFMLRGILKSPAKTFLDVEQWIKFTNLKNLFIAGKGTFDGQGAYAWTIDPCKVNPNCKHFPANIKLNRVSGGHITGITSMDSKFFHIVIDNSDNIEVKYVNIHAPGESRNTDGIHIARSNYVQAHNMYIGTGDDCISFGQGSKNVVISKVNCGPGHGISIGSLGKYENEEDVIGIIVKDCTLRGTTNGVRIKTWAPSPPSKVYDVTFRDIRLEQVQNPIVVDQHYCPNNQCQHKGESQVQISDVKFINIVGSSQNEFSVNMNCSKAKPCQKMELRGLDIRQNGNQPTKAACYFFNGKFNGCLSPTKCW